MSGSGIDGMDGIDEARDRDAAGADAGGRDHLSYQGSNVPWAVVLMWLAFLVWGVAYLVRWIPQSWQEWFSR
jgi:hypothetical protein